MAKKSSTTIKSNGGPVFLGNVENSGTITGRTDIYQQGLSGDEAAKLFDSLIRSVDTHLELSSVEKTQLRQEIKKLSRELAKKDRADENFVMRRLRNIKRMAPDILEVTLAMMTNRALGFGVIAKKIAEKIKAEAI